MGKLVGKIVLTGGPCAGKTTALARIEQDLTEKGFHVFIVGESATELIKGGIRPFGVNPFDLVLFQKLILKYQYEKEQIYEEAIQMLPDGEEGVILFDRGLMDNKAYIPDEVFHQLVLENGMQELDLLDSYDMILHLVTAADGCPEYYTLENNQARTETVDEAIALDKKTQAAWLGHSRLVIVDNSTDFESKINRVLENIYQLLHPTYSIRYQKKYLIDLNNQVYQFLKDIKANAIDIEQTYLQSEQEYYERRLRKRTLNEESTYYLTVQKKVGQGLSKIVTDKKLTEKEYLRLLDYPIAGVITKKRYTFIYQKQYFKLDIINNELALLEVNPISTKSQITLPAELNIIREVTEERDYDNVTLASKHHYEKIKK